MGGSAQMEGREKMEGRELRCAEVAGRAHHSPISKGQDDGLGKHKQKGQLGSGTVPAECLVVKSPKGLFMQEFL